MGKILDITGERYGKLVAIKRSEKRGNAGQIFWTFKCDCGNIKDCSLNSVRQGLIKSCGCLLRPHGEAGTRLHDIWCNMRQRCKEDGIEQHKYWGGKGIKICDEWNNYLVFKEWALTHGYQDNLTIDRIDGNGNYEPNNCRWVTYAEQARNMSKNHYITINGESHIIKDWCEILGNVTPSTVYNRVRKEGWSYEKALLTPPQKSKSLNPQRTAEKYAQRGTPLVAYNDTEVLEFKNAADAISHGFHRSGIYKAIRTGQRHFEYHWKYKKYEEQKNESL